MRLLALDQFSQRGGAQQVLIEAAAAFRAQAWTVEAGLPGDGPVVRSLRDLGCGTFDLPCGPYRSGAKGAAGYARFALDTARMAVRIRRAAAAFSADAIYVNGPRILPAIALARPAAPVIFHSHSLVPAGAMRRAAAWALRATSAAVIANCEFVARQWTGSRSEVIYNGVAGPRAARPQRRGAPVVGCVGRIAPEKGQLAFLEAARRIHAAIPECRFAIWGAAIIAGPAYEARVRRAAESLPVEFAGWIDDPHAALARIDLLLVPSAPWEATTRVIPEAWSAGVPVIAFPAGGIAEIVRHGENGFLASSAAEMADLAVRLLTTDRPALRAAAERGRTHWQAHFTPQQFAARLVDAVSRAVRARATTSAHPTPPDAARRRRDAAHGPR